MRDAQLKLPQLLSSGVIKLQRHDLRHPYSAKHATAFVQPRTCLVHPEVIAVTPEGLSDSDSLSHQSCHNMSQHHTTPGHVS